MWVVRCAALVAAVGCGLVSGTGRGDDKKPAPDEATKAFVAYLAKNGVQLKHDAHNRWVVADPKGDGFEVDVYFRAFKPTATEKEMRDELKTINLAFMLNAPARVAMSHPGLRITDPAKTAPKLDQLPVITQLETLFKTYQLPEPKK